MGRGLVHTGVVLVVAASSVSSLGEPDLASSAEFSRRVPMSADIEATGHRKPKPKAKVMVTVSPSGNDATCVRGKLTKPCASFDHAYALARLGDIVSISGGSYPLQHVTAKQQKAGPGDLPNVVIQPAAGATVTVQGLELGNSDFPNGPSHLTVRGIKDGRSPQGAFEFVGLNDVTLENLDAANFYLDHSSNVRVIGGDWGPCLSPSETCSNSKLDVDTGSNITIQNATFHDYRIVPNSGEHFECLIIFGGRNITLRGNTFRDCEFYNVFVQHPVWAGSGYDGRSPEGMVFENNSFTQVWENGVWGVRFSALAFSPRQIPFRNVTVRCNTLAGRAFVEANDDHDGTRYENFSVTRSCRTTKK
jgi:hypothetical protein